MIRFYIFFFLVVFGCISTHAQIDSITTPIDISIITIGPGSSLNDAFGHNAIRIQTASSDDVYDYGRYDFDDPNFYTNFAQGKLKYLQGKSNYFDVIYFYKGQNRSIDEQVLNLTNEEKRTFNAFLMENYKPENRAYLYDFFYDNCATKIRDVSETITNQNIVFNTPKNFQQKSFRDLIQDHTKWNSWGSLGINVALGSVIDKNATAYEYMFLPKYIHDFFEHATLKKSNEKLVKSSKRIYNKTKITSQSTFFTSPLFILGLLSLIILYITYLDFKKHRRSKIVDILGFLLTGLLGIFILLLWFATDHTATALNYNLLWAFALNIFFVFYVSKTSVSQKFIKYLKFLIIMLGLLIFHWMVGVQKFSLVLIPLLLAVLIRYIYLIYYFNNVKHS
jgi:hypothetical protein